MLVFRVFQSCHDDPSKFVHLAAKPGTQVLEFDDFEPLIQVLYIFLKILFNGNQLPLVLILH